MKKWFIFSRSASEQRKSFVFDEVAADGRKTPDGHVAMNCETLDEVDALIEETGSSSDVRLSYYRVLMNRFSSSFKYVDKHSAV